MCLFTTCGYNECASVFPQDCIAVLYRSLGLCVGAEFSSEDVTLLYRKVFHVPSDTDEARAAMQKVTLLSRCQKSHTVFSGLEVVAYFLHSLAGPAAYI